MSLLDVSMFWLRGSHFISYAVSFKLSFIDIVVYRLVSQEFCTFWLVRFKIILLLFSLFDDLFFSALLHRIRRFLLNSRALRHSIFDIVLYFV